MTRQTVLLFVVVLAAASGCGSAADSAAPVPSRTSATATPTVSRPHPVPSPPGPLALPSRPPSFPDGTAASCAGQPGPDAILALVRAKGVIAQRVRASVTVGPMCAGTWQYSLVSVSGAGLIQVVTTGPPGALQFVAAGTDVCATLRDLAPAGIVRAASC
jgi:hypothetical protein